MTTSPPADALPELPDADRTKHSRYPYTFACDYVRMHVSDIDVRLGIPLPTISRSQASQAIGVIATALGMEKEELAKRLADAYIAQEAA